MYSKKIQNGSDGHCSIEDAKACMELVQLKIKNGKFVYFIFRFLTPCCVLQDSKIHLLELV